MVASRKNLRRRRKRSFRSSLQINTFCILKSVINKTSLSQTNDLFFNDKIKTKLAKCSELLWFSERVFNGEFLVFAILF